MKTSGIIFRGGIALLVASPFIAIFPVVSGQDEVRMPLATTGLVVGAIGLGVIVFGGVQLVRERKRGIVSANKGRSSQLNQENGILAILAFIFLLLAYASLEATRREKKKSATTS